MHIELVKRFEELDVSPDEWNNLADNNETNTVFQTYEWTSVWWNVFSETNELILLKITNNGVLTGIAPLMIRTDKKQQRLLGFISSSHADYLDFILPENKDNAVSAILEYINNGNIGWDKLELINIPGKSSTIQLLKKWHTNHCIHWLVDDSFICPALEIKGHEEFAAKLLRKYSNKRPLNYFNKRGIVKFMILESSDDINSELPGFFAQHISQWEGTRSGSLFVSDKNKKFYSELSQHLGKKKWLNFSVVKYNDESIAYHYGFAYKNSLIWYKPSYSKKYAAHSPGLLMIRFLIQHALDNNLDEFDFTVGDESFKYRFANTTRYNSNFVGYPKLRSYIPAFVKKFMIHLVKKIFHVGRMEK